MLQHLFCLAADEEPVPTRKFMKVMKRKSPPPQAHGKPSDDSDYYDDDY